MSKKNKSETQTEIAGTEKAPRKPRTPVELPPEVQAIVDAEKKAAADAKAQAKNRIKEAKKLGKAVALINGMSSWSLDQIGSAIARRQGELGDQIL